MPHQRGPARPRGARLTSQGRPDDLKDASVQRSLSQRDNDAWEQGNRQFHALLAIHAEERIRQTIKRSIDASERYRRIKLQTIPHAREVAEAEHAAILAACRERDLDAAVEMLARHLARTALTVIAQVAPEYEPTAVRTALRLVTGRAHSSGQSM